MLNTLLFTVVLELCFSSVVNVSTQVALLKSEGGCVFIVEEGYPSLKLELADLTGEEKKVAGEPEIEIKSLEIALELLLDKVQFAMRSRKSSRSHELWEAPERLLGKNFNVIFIPAVASQLKKTSGDKKINFFAGEKGFLMEGSFILGIDSLHLKVDKIRGKLFRPEMNAETKPFWKLIVKPPVKFYGTGPKLLNKPDKLNWLNLLWKELL